MRIGAIALLDDPHVEDQFWVSFTLTSLTDSPEILAVLYDEGSWNNQLLVIKEKGSGRAVLFLLFLDWEETEDDVIVRRYLKDRPERILMRGPYRYDL